jgi:hypothetical protein
VSNEHTPTPWKVDGASVRGASGEWLFDEWFVPANAEFIVRAVNAHDDLVAALKEARAGIWSGCDTVRSIAKIDAALAKAGADQ